MLTQFRNRAEAGLVLARRLEQFADHRDAIVLALPRGGVPVGFEVARHLNLPFDVFVVRKLGVPGQEELAMGAIASGGVRILNRDVLESLRIPQEVIEEVTLQETQELERREGLYRGQRPLPDLKDKTAIVVDDGVATGASMYAAIAALREHSVRQIIVAVPTIAFSTYEELLRKDVEVVAVLTPLHFIGVGQWYEDFSQTTDQEVRDLLHQTRKTRLAIKNGGKGYAALRI